MGEFAANCLSGLDKLRAPAVCLLLLSGAHAIIFADGHTVSNAPDLFRPPKLSGVGPGQYYGGGPPGKTLGCCQLLALGSLSLQH